MPALSNGTEIFKRAQALRRAQDTTPESVPNYTAAAASARRPAKAAWAATTGWLRAAGARGTGKAE